MPAAPPITAFNNCRRLWLLDSTGFSVGTYTSAIQLKGASPGFRMRRHERHRSGTKRSRYSREELRETRANVAASGGLRMDGNPRHSARTERVAYSRRNDREQLGHHRKTAHGAPEPSKLHSGARR